MKPVIILSSAFIGQELAAEYGKIPPSFLPVGHKRLYELQQKSLTANHVEHEIYLSLPETFNVPDFDRMWLMKNQVKLIFVPDKLLLGDAIVYVLQTIKREFQEFGLLHGDTLIYELPLGSNDVVAIGPAPDNYDWGYFASNSEKISSNESMVLLGYFNFSSALLFRNKLAITNNNFVEAVNAYAKQQPLNEFVSNHWFDFGHLLTFYSSRCHIKTQRIFNDLLINANEIRKSGTNHQKIFAEAEWFKTIPLHLRKYTPALLGYGTSPTPWYKLEYISNPTLHELFVFGNLPYPVWSQILGSCFNFLKECIAKEVLDLNILASNYLKIFVLSKTNRRIEQFCNYQQIDMNTRWSYNDKLISSLNEIITITSDYIDEKSNNVTTGVMHGDLCFPNIFYDYRNRKIQVIDPRGMFDDEKASIIGDIRYDIAKLKQSITGYDLILADRYYCTGFEDRNLNIVFPDNEKMKAIESIAEDFCISGISFSDKQISALVIHLYLSMLPLHEDRPDHQKAFLANALRLYSENFS
jgi:hypothetical protein